MRTPPRSAESARDRESRSHRARSHQRSRQCCRSSGHRRLRSRSSRRERSRGRESGRARNRESRRSRSQEERRNHSHRGHAPNRGRHPSHDLQRERSRSSHSVRRREGSQPNVSSQSNNYLNSSHDVVTIVKELCQAMKTDDRGERYPTINVVPEFDPSKRSQTMDMWISKVNECAQIYGWTERQIIHYALPKLAGLAQKWYQGLPSLLFSWTEWQNKLRLAFPSGENYGQLLTEMLACKVRYGDSFEEYFYEKMVLLN